MSPPGRPKGESLRPPAEGARFSPLSRLLIWGLPLAGVAAAAWWVADEMQTSRMQAGVASRLARELHFEVAPSPSPAIRFPGPGPYDLRRGYAQLPVFIERLTARDHAVTAQARMSPRMLELGERGLFAAYREDSQAGLVVQDCRGEPLYAMRYPQRVYERFEAVPPLLVDALLYIENRELLDPRWPTRNPAVEWDRLASAAWSRVRRVVDAGHAVPGGSTLATQIEKYRHSPEGRTESMAEKLRQMASASLRAYLDGDHTLGRRRQIVLDYLNTVPLSAQAGIGEVNGLGDGLWAWYGRDMAEVNQALNPTLSPTLNPTDSEAPWLRQSMGGRALAFKPAPLQRQALAFKQVLSLLIAQRRPSYHLGEGAPGLAGQTERYLRIMAAAGVITPALRDAALPLPLALLPRGPAPAPESFRERKATATTRAKLASLLDVPRSYDLDRLDLTVRTSVDGPVQRAVTQALRHLQDPAGAQAAGLYGHHLLNPGDNPGKLVFSISLYERGEPANLLRVQTDSSDQPFDVNEGAKLDLGSTAKLRTLITYLETVAALHARWAGMNPGQLGAVAVHEGDELGLWAREHLLLALDRSLAGMLAAALEREYPADPAEVFITGGGPHRFVNFEPDEDTQVYSLREAFKHSVNLVFIRLMRDLVNHQIHAAAGSSAAPPAADRSAQLARFADQEGRVFMARFYKQYRGLLPQAAEDLLLRRVPAAPAPLAVVFRSLRPEAGVDALAVFLKSRHARGVPAGPALQALYDAHGPERLSLADRGYVAGVHPLELWLVGHLRRRPHATLAEVTAASRDARQQAYAWLHKTRHTAAQDLRIRSLQERDAFARIQQAWQRLGYPFDTLTPSYATAIGASGDRPAALAELMGIIANQGLRRPASGLLSLAFAQRTPYETQLEARPPAAQRVLPEEVARIVRRSLADVVEDGTARRLKDALVLSDGSVLPVGGKTGTGDHRFEVHGRGGRLISSRVVDRTATFSFVIGERWFGTVMIYAHEPDAAGFRFTSALPAQLLKALWPALRPMVEGPSCGSGGMPPGVLAARAGFVPALASGQEGSSTGSGSDRRRDATLPNTWSQSGLVTP